MVKRNRGKRGGHSRQQLRKHREKTTVNQLLQEFSVGEKVILDIDSSVQDAMPHPRHQGKEGTVIAKRGTCYEVEILDGGKKKITVTSPAHLKKVQTE
jgi:large subunit ribosomal protein L21e